MKHRFSGYLRCVRRQKCCRSGNVWARMLHSLEAEWYPCGWWIDDFGHILSLSQTKRLPGGLTPDMEDEWVTVDAHIEPWENGLGSKLKGVKKP